MASTLFIPGTTVTSPWLNEVDTQTHPYLSAVAGTNTITANGPLSYTAYTQGSTFLLMPQATNTGATTLNINGLGPKAVVYTGAPLTAGTLVTGRLTQVVYDGVQFNLSLSQVIPSTQLSDAATQAVSDNSTKIANTSWVRSAMSNIATTAGFVFAIGGTSSYVRFPSWLGGLIIQWGVVLPAAASTPTPVSFPLAFPTEVRCFLVSSLSGASGVVSTGYFLSNTTGTVMVTLAGNTVQWLALGN